MDPLKKVYDNEADIPEKAKALYEQRDGKWHLTVTIEGMRGQEDLDRLNGALTKERKDHGETKDKLRKFDGLEPDDVRNKLDRLEDLEQGDKLPDQEKIDREVERKINQRLKPVERERDRFKGERDEAVTERDNGRKAMMSRDIRDDLRRAADSAKVVGSAVDDVLLYGDQLFERNEAGETVTRDNIPGVTPGLKPEAWLGDQKTKRPHWWPTSQGANSQGNNGGEGGGENPFSHSGWNVTKQGQMYNADPAKAERMMKAAGVKNLGDARPPAPSR